VSTVVVTGGLGSVGSHIGKFSWKYTIGRSPNIAALALLATLGAVGRPSTVKSGNDAARTAS
jgi:hypothetical protein